MRNWQDLKHGISAVSIVVSADAPVFLIFITSLLLIQHGLQRNARQILTRLRKQIDEPLGTAGVRADGESQRRSSGQE